MEQRKSINHLTAGLIIGALLVVVNILRYVVFKDTPEKVSGWLDWLIVIGGLVYFATAFSKSRDHDVTFGNLFATCFKATAVFTLVIVLFLVVMNVVDPSIKENALETIRTRGLEDKNANEADIEKVVEFMGKYYWAVVIGGALLWTMIMGVIGSLIGAAVAKKNPRPNFDQLDS